MVFKAKLTIFFVDDCAICTVAISKKCFQIMFWTPHEYNSSFLFSICDFTFSVPFTWFAQTSTTQQTRNKSYTKNTKRTNMQTHNKSIMIHTMFKKTITISTINSHILQNITAIFETVKVIKIMSNEWLCSGTPSVKMLIFIVIFMSSSRDFIFTMICDVCCLSYAVFLFVWKIIVIVCGATRDCYVFHE